MIRLTILGNNSAVPAYGRHPTAQVIEINEELFLVDCGEGTQLQMLRYNIKRTKRLNHIFISHLHGDHYFGLIGLICSMALQQRLNPLHIFGPAGLREIIELQLTTAGTQLPYELHFHLIEAADRKVLVDTDFYEVRCFPVEHRIPCHGFIFHQRHTARKLLPERCQAYNIPTSWYHALKNGQDYQREDGVLVKNEWVTAAPDPGKRYAYCADTRFCDSFIEDVRDVDFLYHESTYLEDNTHKALERFHSTAAQAAEIARQAGAGKLLLGHFSSRYEQLDPFYAQASAVFPNVEISEEGRTYEI